MIAYCMSTARQWVNARCSYTRDALVSDSLVVPVDTFASLCEINPADTKKGMP